MARCLAATEQLLAAQGLHLKAGHTQPQGYAQPHGQGEPQGDAQPCPGHGEYHGQGEPQRRARLGNAQPRHAAHELGGESTAGLHEASREPSPVRDNAVQPLSPLEETRMRSQQRRLRHRVSPTSSGQKSERNDAESTEGANAI